MASPAAGSPGSWQYRLLGEDFGPVSLADLKDLLQDGSLTASDEVCGSDGLWRRAADVPELTADEDLPALDDGLASLLEQAGASTPQRDTPGKAPARDDGWYVRTLGAELGPIDWDQLSEMQSTGELTEADEVRAGRAGQWQRASEIVGLFAALSEDAAPSTAAASAAPPQQTFHHQLGGETSPPLTWDDLKALAASGRLSPRDRIREGSSGSWLRAATLPGLFAEQERARTWAGQAEQAVDVAARAVPDATAATAEPEPPPVAAEPEAPAPPPDRWENFFNQVEERERRQRRTEPRLATDTKPAAKPDPTPVVPPSAAIAPQIAPVSQPPAATSPRSAPNFTAARKSSPSLRLPSLDFSGLFDRLKGGGAGINPALLGGLAVAAVICGLMYAPISFGGQPGAEDYPRLAQLWQAALQLREKKADAAAWTALQSEILPALDEMQSRLAPVVASEGKEAPIAQRILWMVDIDSGPTSSNGYLRKILSAGPAATDADFNNGSAVMSEANALLPES